MTDRQNRALEILRENVALIQTSDQWKAALDIRSRFHQYSFNNCMLIALQRPDATLVAGYRKWQEMKRQVRKGERSIAIFAPMLKKVQDEESGEWIKRLIGFKSVGVFDVAQTDGEPLPEPPRPQPLTGRDDEADALFVKIAEFAASVGSPITVTTDGLGRANGMFSLLTKAITVSPNLPPLQRLKTAVHEVAHAILHSDTIPADSYDLGELEAESTAYLVGDALGIDTSAYSFAYLAGYAGEPDALLKAGQNAVKAADRIIEALSA